MIKVKTVREASKRERQGAALATREQAAGALHNGTQVEKCSSEPDDAHRDGDRGFIIGSMGPIDGMVARYVYCVAWDSNPDMPVWIAGHRVRPVSTN